MYNDVCILVTLILSFMVIHIMWFHTPPWNPNNSVGASDKSFTRLIRIKCLLCSSKNSKLGPSHGGRAFKICPFLSSSFLVLSYLEIFSSCTGDSFMTRTMYTLGRIGIFILTFEKDTSFFLWREKKSLKTLFSIHLDRDHKYKLMLLRNYRITKTEIMKRSTIWTGG